MSHDPVNASSSAPLALAEFSVHMGKEISDLGWIDLRVTLGRTTKRIMLSFVYDPMPGLLDWLLAIQRDNLPIELEIDEEGVLTSLVADTSGHDRLFVAVIDRWERKEWAAAVVDRQSFLDIFRAEFLRFLTTHLHVQSWQMNAADEPPDHYLNRLLAHPFLA